MHASSITSTQTRVSRRDKGVLAGAHKSPLFFSLSIVMSALPQDALSLWFFYRVSELLCFDSHFSPLSGICSPFF